MKRFKLLRNKWMGLILVLLIFLSACSDATAERKLLYLNLNELNYSSENRILIASYSTNIPMATKVWMRLSSPSGEFSQGLSPMEIEGTDNEGIVEFFITDESISDLMDGKYLLEAEIDVDDDKDFYYQDVGGNPNKVSKRYENSEKILVKIKEDSEDNAYTLKIKSNELEFETGVTEEERKLALENIEREEALKETEEAITEVHETISETNFGSSFKEYNDKYYKSFKNQLDLIASNFEILAMDGYRNRDVVDDLIRWTNEFDELLDVYEVNAIPANGKDEELLLHTSEMLENQRGANEYIIKGLTERDDLSYLIAEEYLYTVADMYLEGYKKLNY